MYEISLFVGGVVVGFVLCLALIVALFMRNFKQFD